MDDTGILVSPADARRAVRSATRARPARKRLRWVPWVAGAIAIAGLGVATAYWAFGPVPGVEASASAAPGERDGEREEARAAEDLELEVRALEAELAATKAALSAQQTASASLLDAQKELAAKAAEADALKQKFATVLDGGGTVESDGDEIRLQLVDKVLFRLGSAQLTPRGEKVLDRVGKALAEMPDKQIWVQGHTDDQPITGRGDKEPTWESNWELSAARALTVVHFLEDVTQVDPKRLAAVAFGEHRPVSRKNKAKNRRIEIVLYPRSKLIRE